MDAASINPLTTGGATAGWQSGTGAILFGVGGAVGTNGGTMTLHSGKTAGTRADFSMSSQGSASGAPSSVTLNGFKTVDLDIDRAGTALAVNASEINISAATLGDTTTTLKAASFDASNNYFGPTGWTVRPGVINFLNPNVAFTGAGALELGSGTGSLSGGTRNDFLASVDVSGTRTSLILQGFRDVVLDEAINTTGGWGIMVTGRNIQVEQNLTTGGENMQLQAGSYDTGSSPAGAFSTSAHRTQPGLLRFTNPATTVLTGGRSITLTSGLDYVGNPFSPNGGAATPSGEEARVDLPSTLTFARRPGDVLAGAPYKDISLWGFRDVTLFTGEVSGNYSVAARNIVIPASITGMKATNLSLQAGVYEEVAASPLFPGSPSTVHGVTSTVNGLGTITRQGGAELDLEGQTISLQSGIGPGPSRTDLNLGVLTGRGPGLTLGVTGFNNITTKANSPIDVAQIILRGSSILARSDITANAIELTSGWMQPGTMQWNIFPGTYSGTVRDVAFDGVAGIVYDSSTPLVRAGITSSSAVGGTAPSFGDIRVATASGDLVLNQRVDSLGTGGTVALSGAGSVVFNAMSDDPAHSAYARSTDTVQIAAGKGSIVNASGLGGAGQEQVRGHSAVLSASDSIGRGVIDNGLTGSDNLQDLNLDTQELRAVATQGGATLWNRGAVNLVGSSSAAAYFGINAGGRIAQASGATLAAGNAEFDTMRDASIGTVDLRNRPTLNVAGLNLVGGKYRATSETGAVQMSPGSVLHVNGDVALDGQPVDTTAGTIAAAGLVAHNGAVVPTTGNSRSALSVSGSVATVTAFGAAADFDLSRVLTPAVLTSLAAAGVTDVVVNLGNGSIGYSVAQLRSDAILINGAGNEVAGGWTVRTGNAALATSADGRQQYNLTDAGGTVELGAMNLAVNAARGTAYAAGSSASPVAAAPSTFNAASGFDVASGSSVELTRTSSSGTFAVRDASDILIRTPASIHAGYIYGNGDVSLLAGSAEGGRLSTSGALHAGRHLIGVAGTDIVLGANTTIQAGGNVTLVADETAGLASGPGRFVNLASGLDIQAGGGIGIYAVAGGTAPPGHEFVPSQVSFNGLRGNGLALSETQPATQWNHSYQNDTGGSTYVPGSGRGEAPHVRYKEALVASPPPPPPPPPPPSGGSQHPNDGRDTPAWSEGRSPAVTPTRLDPAVVATWPGPMVRALGSVQGPDEGGCAWIDSEGRRYMPQEYGPQAYFAPVAYLPNSAGEGAARSGERVTPCRDSVPYIPTVKDPEITLDMWVTVTPSGGGSETHRVAIGADGLFRFDGAGMDDLLPDGRARLEQLAREIRQGFSQVLGILVIAHADRLGSETYNLRLSRRRAETVRSLLMSNGLDGRVIRTEGRGKAEPVKSCEGQTATPATVRCLQPNRRVTVDVTALARP